MIAGTLEIQMLANLARLSADMAQAKGIIGGAMKNITESVNVAKSALVALGAGFSFNLIKNYTVEVISATAALDDMAERTGASVEKLSELTTVAKIGGTSVETLETGMIKLAKSIAVVGQTTDAASGALKAIGLSKGQLQGLDTADAFKLVAQRLNEYADGLNKTAVLQALFGKGGAALAPIIKDLAEQHDKVRVITAQEAAEAERLEKQWRQLVLTASELKKSFIIDMIPQLNEIVRQMRDAAQESGILGATWAALGGFIALFADFPSEVARMKAEIKALQGDISTWEKALKGLPSSVNEGVRKLYEQNIAQARARLELVQHDFVELQNKLQQAAAKVQPKPEIPELPDLAALKAAGDAEQKFLDAQLKAELDEFTDVSNHKKQILQLQYQNFEMSDENYYRRSLELAKDDAESKIALLDFQRVRLEEELNKQTTQTKEYYEARAKLDANAAARNTAIREFGQAAETAFLQAKRAADAYQDSIRSIDAQILELTGDSAKAAAIRFDLQNKNTLNKIIAENDPEALQSYERLKTLTQAQADFNQKKTELSDLNALLAVQEERIQNSQRTGAISELDGLQRTSEARRSALDSMQKTVDALKQIALASNNPALLLQAEQAAVALEKLRTETDLVAQKFETIFTDSFSSAFSDFITGAKTAKQAFSDFANSVVRQLSNLYAEALAKNIWRAMGFGNAGGSGGGILGSGGLLGLLGIGSTSTYSSGNTTYAGELFGQFAMGTDYVPRTGPYLLHQGERVVTASDNANWGGDIIIQNTIDARGADVGVEQRIEVAMEKVKRSIVPIVADAKRRNAFGRIL